MFTHAPSNAIGNDHLNLGATGSSSGRVLAFFLLLVALVAVILPPLIRRAKRRDNQLGGADG